MSRLSERAVLSMKTLRLWVGVIAFLLPPLVVLVTGIPLFNAISSYYWSPGQDIFVSMLVVVGVFLFTYRGYGYIDAWLTTLAGLLAILIAILPNAGNAGAIDPELASGLTGLPNRITDTLHDISAGLFFTILAYISFFEFTKGTSNTPEKRKRNTVYRVCGLTMFGTLVFMAIAAILDPVLIVTTPLFFWTEVILLYAFGTSWLVKGEAVWGDL